jgi:hypothetical protein
MFNKKEYLVGVVVVVVGVLKQNPLIYIYF